MAKSAEERNVFLTVGTTKFDALVRAADAPAVADELAVRGYTGLTMQIGAGSYLPRNLVPEGIEAQLPNGLRVRFFTFAPDLANHMRSADLIISHAGSGSLFEALQLRRPLVVVPNAILMANHQVWC